MILSPPPMINDEKPVEIVQYRQPGFSVDYAIDEDFVDCTIDEHAVRTSDLLIFLEDYYRIDDYRSVFSFIDRNRFLAAFLSDIYHAIESYFGPDTIVLLKVYDDPESEDDLMLFGLIETYLSPDEALNRLESFDENILIDRLEKCDFLFNVDVKCLE